MSLKLKHMNRGFTIIEVMIVLAIAALILIIVLFAVPALQRSARNTQRKNDVSAVIAGINEYEDNNGGTLPNTCSGSTTLVWSNTAGTPANSDTVMGYYNKGGCTVAAAPGAKGRVALDVNGGAGVGPLASTAAQDYMIVVTGAGCAATGATNGGSPDSVAVLYEIETSGGFTPECQSS